MSHLKKVVSDGTSTMDTTGALAHLDQAIAALALTPQSITVKQRKAATRSRKGMEKVIPTLADLSTEHGIAYPKQPTAVMTSNLALVTQLESVKNKLVSALTLVQDNIDGVRSDTWSGSMMLYGMLQKVAHRDSQLRSQLAPVKEFFAYRTPAAKKRKQEKQAANAAGQQAAAQATVESSAAGAPQAPAATASANAGTPAASNVVTPHTP